MLLKDGGLLLKYWECYQMEFIKGCKTHIKIAVSMLNQSYKYIFNVSNKPKSQCLKTCRFSYIVTVSCY